MDLDSAISERVRQSLPVTLEALGGLAAISSDQALSPMFPYVVSALNEEWESLDPEERDTAKHLIATAITGTSSGLALSDICQVIVPAAVDLGIALEVKASLRERVRTRDDERSGALAAIALRWLANLAVVSDAARGAVIDALSEVGLESSEAPPFVTVAAQVAGVVYDQWRDSAATGCLTRLAKTSGDPDAWFALGQGRLVDALDATDHDSCVAGLRSTLECFDYAAANGEERPDAVMYANAVRFVIAWAADASAEMLADYYRNAHRALHQYMLHGLHLPGQPVWLRPRYEAETAWMALVKAMEIVADSEAPDLRWYDAAIAIGGLAEVYRAANSFRPFRTNSEHIAEGVTDLVSPRLTAPFVNNSERLAYIGRWLQDVEDPEAEAFGELVRGRLDGVVPSKSYKVGQHLAISDLLGGEPGGMPDSGLLDLIEQRLQDRRVHDRSMVHPVVNQIIEATLRDLSHSPDFAGRVKEQLQPIIVSVIRFLSFCLNAQKGGLHSHTGYLFDPEAHEGQLQQHISEWFYGASGFTDLVIEAQQVAAGRIDLMLTFEGFRFVIELKREQEDATRQGLSLYLRQAAAYQATDIAVGMLVVLDLTTSALPDHMRDHVWVDAVPSSEQGGTNRYVAVVRIPGNRTAPSRIPRR